MTIDRRLKRLERAVDRLIRDREDEEGDGGGSLNRKPGLTPLVFWGPPPFPLSFATKPDRHGVRDVNYERLYAYSVHRRAWAERHFERWKRDNAEAIARREKRGIDPPYVRFDAPPGKPPPPWVIKDKRLRPVREESLSSWQQRHVRLLKSHDPPHWDNRKYKRYCRQAAKYKLPEETV